MGIFVVLFSLDTFFQDTYHASLCLAELLIAVLDVTNKHDYL